MAEEKYSDRISDFLEFLRESRQDYSIADVEQTEANHATQDIMHCLELEDHSYHDTARLALSLMRVRRQRRSAKNTMKLLLPIITWIEQNGKTIKTLERLLGYVRHAEDDRDGRIYFPKTNILSETNKRKEKTQNGQMDNGRIAEDR